MSAPVTAARHSSIRHRTHPSHSTAQPKVRRTAEGIRYVKERDGRYFTKSLPYQDFRTLADLKAAVKRAFPDEFSPK